MKKNYEKPMAFVVSFQSSEELALEGSMGTRPRPGTQDLTGLLEDKSDFQFD